MLSDRAADRRTVSHAHRNLYGPLTVPPQRAGSPAEWDTGVA